jgi:hypothetical protein
MVDAGKRLILGPNCRPLRWMSMRIDASDALHCACAHTKRHNGPGEDDFFDPPAHLRKNTGILQGGHSRRRWPCCRCRGFQDSSLALLGLRDTQCKTSARNVQGTRKESEYCRSSSSSKWPSFVADRAEEVSLMSARGQLDPNYRYDPRPKILDPAVVTQVAGDEASFLPTSLRPKQALRELPWSSKLAQAW